MWGYPSFLNVIPTEVEGALLYGGGFAAFLEDGILVSQPSPLGEGAPKGQIGHWQYERGWGKRRVARHMWEKRESEGNAD